MSNEIPAVKLKGVGDGLWVTINPELPEETIYKEISALFERLKHLAINAKVVLDIGNVQGYDNLIGNIRLLLKSRFDVGSVIEPPQNKTIHSEFNKQNPFGIKNANNTNNMVSKGFINDRSEALMLAGRIRSGQRIETNGHLIIAGNVNPGAQLRASGNVIVIGTLHGEVHAGYPDDEDAFVIALDFKTPNIQIGGTTSLEHNSELSGKIVFAAVHDGKIILHDYLKIQPFGKLPWPTIL